MGNSLEAESLSRQKYVMDDYQHLSSKVKFILESDGKIHITVYDHLSAFSSEVEDFKKMYSKRLNHIKKILYHKANRSIHANNIEDSKGFAYVNNIKTYLKSIFQKKQKLCDKPWFNIDSPDYQKLTLSDDKKEIIEADSIKSLRIIQKANTVDPSDKIILYQHWGADIKSKEDLQCRVYSWLDTKTSKRIARIINKSRIKNFILLFSAIEPGSIRIFADTLKSHQLDMLGLFWYLSGDDITDYKESISDIVYAIDKLSVKRLSILTGDFDDECEIIFSEKLEKNKSLKNFSVFQKDDNHKWPKIQTSIIENLIKERETV